MELSLDILRNDAFSVTSLRRLVDNLPFVPTMLGDMGLFTPQPVRTREIVLYEEDGNVHLIPTTEIGSPDVHQIRDTGRARLLHTKRLAKMDTVRAGELIGIANTAIPETIRLRTAQELTAKRLAKLKSDMEATKELHRLGALQGKLVDANGTVIYNYFDEYGISQPATINLNFAATSETDLMMFFQENVIVPMELTLKDRAAGGVRVGCLVGDYFWGRLMRHPGFRKMFELQALARAGAADVLYRPNNWRTIEFAGITWINYRGSTGGEIAIPAADAIFFPIGATDVFDVYWAPGETLLDITEPGRPEYSYLQPDVRTAMPEKLDIFLRSYPLYACIYPKCLIRMTTSG
jgi:hypothetical protein